MLKKQMLIHALLTLTMLSAAALAAEPSEPGVAYGERQLGGARPGSVLIYNAFASDAVGGTEQNTEIALTNTNTVRAAYVHLFFVSGADCNVADTFICLTPNQTARFLASDVDPGTEGYVLAVAVNNETGCPIQFNSLIGSELVRYKSGHTANLPAEAVAALSDLRGCRASTPTTTLNFNDRDYARLPRVLAADRIPSNLDGNSTMFIVNSINGNLVTGITPAATLFGVLWDDAESGFSFSVNGACQTRRVLTDSFPRTTPRFSQIIPQGRSGWLRLNSTREQALTGAVLYLNPESGTTVGAFTGGHNLHHLRAAESATLTMPVFPPAC